MMPELKNNIEDDEPSYMTIRKLQEDQDSLLKEIDQLHSMLKRQEGDIGAAWNIYIFREVELAQLKEILANREEELSQTKAILTNREGELSLLRRKGKAISQELELFRSRKIIQVINRFIDKSNAWNNLPLSFQQVKDDSLIFTKRLTGYRLQPSINLDRVPFLQYPLYLDRPNLKGILLAPILELSLLTGILGVEIISPSNNIVCQSSLQVDQILESEPTCLEFSPIAGSDKGHFSLRVFVREVDGPVRIFEWRKYSAFGLGPLHTRAFCGFIFDDAQ